MQQEVIFCACEPTQEASTCVMLKPAQKFTPRALIEVTPLAQTVFRLKVLPQTKPAYPNPSKQISEGRSETLMLKFTVQARTPNTREFTPNSALYLIQYFSQDITADRISRQQRYLI